MPRQKNSAGWMSLQPSAAAPAPPAPHLLMPCSRQQKRQQGRGDVSSGQPAPIPTLCALKHTLLLRGHDMSALEWSACVYIDERPTAQPPHQLQLWRLTTLQATFIFSRAPPAGPSTPWCIAAPLSAQFPFWFCDTSYYVCTAVNFPKWLPQPTFISKSGPTLDTRSSSISYVTVDPLGTIPYGASAT